MRSLEDTGQARDAAILAPAPDSPERVDTAMRRQALEYHGAGGRYAAGDVLRLWDGPRLVPHT